MATKKFKQFKVDFYVVTEEQRRENTVLTNLLHGNQVTEALALNADDNEHFQIRSITSINSGSAYKAVFGRCRFGETPVQGDANGNEEDVELKPGHGLVEKNHFLFFPNNNLLVYQRNSTGSHYSKLQRYIARAGDSLNAALEPILTSDAYTRLIKSTEPIKQIDLSFQAPKDPSLYQQIWTKDAIRLLNSSGGLNARITISMGRQDGHLVGQMRDAAVTLARAGLARVARVKLEEIAEPIDLIADRVIETVQVLMGENGRPIPEMVHAALEEARHRRSEDLKRFFGT